MILRKGLIRVLSLFLSLICVLSLAFSASAESKDEFINDEIVINDKISGSYTAYLANFSESDYSKDDIVTDLNDVVLENENIEFEINVKNSGLYNIGMSYKALDTKMAYLQIGLKVDGEYPYTNLSEINFPRMWKDADDVVQTDDLGNEFASQQVLYSEYYYNDAVDETVEAEENYMVFLQKGSHVITLLPVSGKVQIEYFKFSASAPLNTYQEPKNKNEYYSGDSIILEGESAKIKSNYCLIDKSDTASIDITPQNTSKNLLNYVGGGNWKTVGEKLVWETPSLKAGYYQLGFSYRQNTNIGGKSYRKLTIDGKVPFSEAEEIGFSYGDNWEKYTFCDKEEKPYLIYLSEGKHEIALTVTAADIGSVRNYLTEAISEMGDLYVDITKITGETVDIYRDYDLFKQIGDMEERLNKILNLLEKSAQGILKITGEKSGSKYSVIMNTIRTIEQMIKNKYESHRYKKTFYSDYCSVSSVLQELREMPLDLDKIILFSPDNENPYENKNLFEKIIFSAKRFFVSFSKDYTIVSDTSENDSSLTIWVNWGRDQAQVLNSLINRSFTPKTGINVNLKLANASVIQALLAGNGPDCFLQKARSEPVNLAMRGVLYDLSQFEDCDEVLERFQDGAEDPYRYEDGLYALPDTQTFFMMFYRKDILDEYGLSVPKTWDEFDLTAKLLMRNNMSVWLPIHAVTDAATAAGIGSTSIYPSLMLQNNVDIYSKDGKKTNLLSADAMEVFGKWTGYYTKLKFPKSLDFYNRFRTGTTPLGIAAYTTYNTIKAAASEIDGLWGVTSVPATVLDDGTLSYATSGAGTGCTIVKDSPNKDEAWEFLKWWTSSETQFTYSNDLETILGPTGRMPVANVEALSQLSWEPEHLKSILKAWEEVEEIPEYPGSYYVSRSIYQAYWNVVNSNKNSKDMLMKFGKEADEEIDRKWNQYINRK